MAGKTSGKIKLSFPDKSEAEFAMGVKAEEVVKQHFKKEQAAKALGARINSKVIDLSAPLDESGEFDILTFETDAGLDLFRHSSSHVMALAVKRLYKDVKVAIGPSIEDGFYYDFDNLKINDEDFPKIEDEIKKIVHEKLMFERKEVSKQEALKIFKDEPYKVDLINELPEGEKITTYKLGEFEDLCRGPHVPNSGVIGAIKLLKLAGAYWRGDCKNKMLTRIYAISFPDKKMLEDYLKMIEEAKKRDHRKLGQEMDLFSFHDEGRGFPFWHPKGMILLDEVVNYWKIVHKKYGYGEIKTPIILNKELWLRSGHWEHYKENMYFTQIDNSECAVKPMNCPGGILVYKDKLHSYKEFPLKIAELGLVHRHELSGVLHGLARVRSFTQDDAHVYCLPEQLEQEIINIIELVYELYGAFGLKDYHVELSTKPEHHIGTDDVWEKAEKALENALKNRKVEYELNPGEGAFYGPKIDFHIKDSLGRDWQCGTIQVDFSMPERFDMEYEGQDGRRHRPVMIHRAILGSLERFIAIILENYAGKLPLWINPGQVKILPIADRHMEYARKIADEMRKADLRVEIDTRSESTSKKVRDAQVEKVNYILVVGDREMANNSVNVRTRNNEVLGEKKVSELINELLVEIKEKTIK
ncbi:threonine--tRNA ligase [Candidatus Woesearchaeota archaeon]|nr:threonine--tRNA ligase [Candidatus Woesearchaeota archaeon]